MSQERSAEWLRGAVESHINTCNLITSITSVNESRTSRHGLIAANTELHNQLDSYRALLAEAEAREASVPTAADLAVADELDLLAAHIQEYIGPDDARDDIRRICLNRAADLRRGVKRGPSAAEVIATAERERDELRKENDFMRLRLAESDKACVYCDLPKAEMGACAHGFPGCARADDLFHCDELTRRDAQQRREGAAEWLENAAREGGYYERSSEGMLEEAKQLREGK